jgi:tetratricopeptide (TPR) repeat protein
MAALSSNPFASNRHADVLSVEPTDEAGKLRLLEEVKHRAKGAFSAKDMQSAELLYGKAIALLDAIPEKREAALYSNRAMVRLNLSKIEEALADANKCLEVDPKFVKAYHRKAQALLRLSEWDDAIAAAEEGAILEPTNSAFNELIEKAKKDKEKDAEDKVKLKRDAQDVKVELHNASTARAPPVKKKVDEGEDSSMRGYKKTADGKTTSYFHTEISEEAKELIAKQGFGKPQKLEVVPAEAADVKGGGSSWNQAGTYEEKNMAKWIDESLRAALSNISFAVPGANPCTIVAKSVENIVCDASISISRGKRRHLLDLSFDLVFEGTVGDLTGKGTLSFSDVTSSDDSMEINMQVDAATPPALREVFDSFVKTAGQGFQPVAVEAVCKLVREYQAK